jgi:expansin (peptidoglycan-binding protein)
MICAISHLLYGTQSPIYRKWLLIADSAQTSTNPNDNPFCGRRIRATRHRNGVNGNVSVDVTIVDRCTGCKLYDLDFSPGAFDKMADESLGRVDVTWAFLD